MKTILLYCDSNTYGESAFNAHRITYERRWTSLLHANAKVKGDNQMMQPTAKKEPMLQYCYSRNKSIKEGL